MRTDYQHDVAYRKRKQEGLQAVEQPWHWLRLADIKEIAETAYKVASYQLNEFPMSTFEHSQRYFVDVLYAQLGTYLAEAAVAQGMPVTVVPGIGPNQAAVLVGAARMRNKVDGWRPQYPAYKKVAPAERGNAPGAVINADEGNVNVHNSSS